jgi:Xaa-Pro dipeptidase
MFSGMVYKNRREILVKNIDSGIILLMGNEDTPIDYPGSCYSFVQDNTFLYYAGIDNYPGLAMIIDIDENKEILFGDDFTLDDEIWMGEQSTVSELAAKTHIDNCRSFFSLSEYIDKAVDSKREIHYLPICQSQVKIKLEKLLETPCDCINNNASELLIKAVIKQRSVKTNEEVGEIEAALDITYEMYDAVLNKMKPGMYEREIAGLIQGIVLKKGCRTAFPPIVTINGKILHNVYFGNKLKKNDLLLIDSGAKSSEWYCADITRTFPVGGKFTTQQKDIYNIVLKMQKKAIGMLKPGIPYVDVHLKAAKIAVDGLKTVGLMKGNTEDAVKNGAHALFFPHGLGHMLGLEAHDMEGLGENYIGYDEKYQRSLQFGLSALRMAKELKSGYVLTVEPGLYFIPKLIDLWKSEGRNCDYINYDIVESYRNFEGIRVEDDVVVTNNGARVLGKKSIPKDIADIENRILFD